MNDSDINELRREIVKIEQLAEKTEVFIESEFGKDFLERLQTLHDEYISTGDRSNDAPLRAYDVAQGIRRVRDLIYSPIEALKEGGIVDEAKKQLKNATDPQS